MSVKKHVSDTTHMLGTILMCGGGAGLFIMAAVGTISVDLVLLSFASKQRNPFLTGFILGSLFSRSTPMNPLLLLAVSPITTTIAIVLSVALGVPGVGLALAVGWAITAAVFLLGYGIRELAKEIAKPARAESGHTATPSTREHHGFFRTQPNVDTEAARDFRPGFSPAAEFCI